MTALLSRGTCMDSQSLNTRLPSGHPLTMRLRLFDRSIDGCQIIFGRVIVYRVQQGDRIDGVTLLTELLS